ncbi:hypothetical protein A0H81_07985 [Grifola frondosa]|uniref:Gamma-glutamylcyclotransferase AIG2-like domain-containing protein n=1 Tax=Grifola frondosa TaxID=5627 RepID=A0A1C7M627_GRIFR|nr:hypothetical protein A0H81_07985 [Grifola frondosa]
MQPESTKVSPVEAEMKVVAESGAPRSREQADAKNAARVLAQGNPFMQDHARAQAVALGPALRPGHPRPLRGPHPHPPKLSRAMRIKKRTKTSIWEPPITITTTQFSLIATNGPVLRSQMTEPFSAFFYGTLLHPSILRRVIGHQGETLEICPALLPYADYPAVLPYSKSHQLFPDPSTAPSPRAHRARHPRHGPHEERHPPARRLRRHLIRTHNRRSAPPRTPNPSLRSTHADRHLRLPRPPRVCHPPGALPPAVPAQTYIWADPISDLTPALWEFADFVRENAWKWVGEGARFNEDYTAVDHTRAMAGSAPGSPEGEDGQV